MSKFDFTGSQSHSETNQNFHRKFDFDIIIYHGNCPDGFSGAWAFWTKLKDQCQYLPYRYGQEPPDVTGKRVAIVDFSFRRDVLIGMASQADYLVVLDHHKTAERDLDSLTLPNGEIIFDMERSGAQIAWDYLYNTDRPWFLDYVADRDLWRHVLPNTREISEALFFDGYYQDFAKLQSLVNADKDQFAERGAVLLEFKNKQCQYYAQSATPTILTVGDNQYRVNLAGCPRAYRSDVGNIICSTQDCDFAGVYWYDFRSQEWWVSFRASSSSTHDLSEITSHLPNGGGHPKAAGFTIYRANGENLHTYFS